MEKFHELPRWVQFGLAALLALVMLFAMVFEVSLPVFAPVPGATDVAIGAQGAVRERIAIDTREDSYFYSGADLYFYSDDHSTQKFHVDGATGNVDAEGTANFAGAVTLSKGSGNGLVVTAAIDANGTADFQGAVTLQSTLDVQGGDITLENDETVSNSTDGVVQVGGFLALTEGAVVEVTAAGTITPLASFQPITSSVAITNAVLADGTLGGQLLVLINENASDDITILETGSNLDAGGDITLTGGALDALTLLWDGAQWVRLSFEDN